MTGINPHLNLSKKEFFQKMLPVDWTVASKQYLIVPLSCNPAASLFNSISVFK